LGGDGRSQQLGGEVRGQDGQRLGAGGVVGEGGGGGSGPGSAARRAGAGPAGSALGRGRSRPVTWSGAYEKDKQG
jgi:hypothetical protein